MLDQLVEFVSEKTGHPEGQARMAAGAVINFLKDKLPEPIGGQLDTFLGTGNDQGGGNDLLGGVAQGLLGNIFGNKQ